MIPTIQGNIAMAKLTTLLFDVDGTLADTEEIHRRAFNAAFADAGLDWIWDSALYRELLQVTGGKERIRFYLERFREPGASAAVSDDRIAGLHQHKTVHYTRMLATGEVPLRPGVERLMREALARGLRLAIVTTTTPVNVTALLEHSFQSNTGDWFDVIAAGGVVSNKKPAPDIYYYALQQLGVQAAECLAIEDSSNGLEAARAAGVDALVTVNPYTEHHDFRAARVVLDHLGEPGRPCQVLAGGPDPGGLVDVDYLQRLHVHQA